MPQPLPPQPDQAGAQNGASFATFTGLKNTVSPESLTARELSRAQNVDIDDLGQVHRRRGRRRVSTGRWHSLVSTGHGLVLGVKDGSLVLVRRDYSSLLLVEGIAEVPLSYAEVGPTLYATSRFNSFQVDLPSLQVRAWGRVVGHSYQPGLEPAGADFWFSPVVRPDDRPEAALGAVGGRLLGPPLPGQLVCYYNGRLYIAVGHVLWATELFLYNFVDRNRGYRLYEAEITGLCAVEDGLYVGTTQALYFVSGRYGEETRVQKEPCGVVPGSMIAIPGEVADPEGRRFPDLPRQTSRGMACMTSQGIIVGLGGGQTYNLTRQNVAFPAAVSASAMLRQEDGMNTLVMPLRSNGAPADTARFGDYLSAVLIRAGTPGQPGSPQA